MSVKKVRGLEKRIKYTIGELERIISDKSKQADTRLPAIIERDPQSGLRKEPKPTADIGPNRVGLLAVH